MSSTEKTIKRELKNAKSSGNPDDYDAIYDKLINADQWDLLINTVVEKIKNMELLRKLHSKILSSGKYPDFKQYVILNDGKIDDDALDRLLFSVDDIDFFKELYSPEKLKFDFNFVMEEIKKLINPPEKILQYVDASTPYNDMQKSICKNKKSYIVVRRNMESAAVQIDSYMDTAKNVFESGKLNPEKKIITIDLYSNNVLPSLKSFFDIKNIDIDTDFFIDNSNFIKSLPIRKVLILSSYTYQGDNLTNTYILSNSDPNKKDEFKNYLLNWTPDTEKFLPIYYQLDDKLTDEAIKSGTEHKSLSLEKAVDYILELKNTTEYISVMSSLVSGYIQELKSIFIKAPKIRRQTTVYRGSKTMYYGQNGVYNNNTFMSTSINPQIAFRFADRTEACCFSKIILPVGFRTVFMEPITQANEEYEYLIPPGTTFNIVKHTTKLLTVDDDVYSDYKSVCTKVATDMSLTVFKAVV